MALLLAFLAFTPAFGAVCSNWDEDQCSKMCLWMHSEPLSWRCRSLRNDGSCSCYWQGSGCSMNSSDCSSVGITSVGDCTLTGGETVNDGWSGNDTGSNACNGCSCSAGSLSCDDAVCCTLTGGLGVAEGWSGYDSGSNFCNMCSCSQGHLACDEMECNSNCTLTGGEVVSDGWGGKDTGSNACNGCNCVKGNLMCTLMACTTATSGSLRWASKMAFLAFGVSL